MQETETQDFREERHIGYPNGVQYIDCLRRRNLNVDEHLLHDDQSCVSTNGQWLARCTRPRPPIPTRGLLVYRPPETQKPNRDGWAKRKNR